MKLGRNEPCHCGSGKKFKKCHGSFTAEIPHDFLPVLRKLDAAETIRKKQQGGGRPIISMNFQDHQFVAVKNKLYRSKKWKTFPDFLFDYIKATLGSDWGNAEIKKDFSDRHPIIQWYHEVCIQQKKAIKKPGEPVSSEVTGAFGAYLGLAYCLYLLDHNVELQERLIKRLKNIGNFQGAYYEVLVAGALVLAGFELHLEDETSRSSRHCEFYAVSKKRESAIRWKPKCDLSRAYLEKRVRTERSTQILSQSLCPTSTTL